jgi:hypothetical protein
MDSHDNDMKPEPETDTDTDSKNEITMLITSNIDTPNVDDTSPLTADDSSYVNGVTLSSDSEITTIYDVATNTIINMYNFLYDYSEYCIDHNMV